jgi:hypothetical protein
MNKLFPGVVPGVMPGVRARGYREEVYTRG